MEDRDAQLPQFLLDAVCRPRLLPGELRMRVEVSPQSYGVTLIFPRQVLDPAQHVHHRASIFLQSVVAFPKRFFKTL